MEQPQNVLPALAPRLAVRLTMLAPQVGQSTSEDGEGASVTLGAGADCTGWVAGTLVVGAGAVAGAVGVAEFCAACTSVSSAGPSTSSMGLSGDLSY